MDVPKCKSWMGHKFEGRYSLGAAVIPPDLKVSIAVDSLTGIYSQFRTQTYVHDICVRCGYVIEKAAK
jgi:hypothetical protein